MDFDKYQMIIKNYKPEKEKKIKKHLVEEYNGPQLEFIKLMQYLNNTCHDLKISTAEELADIDAELLGCI